MSKFGLSSFLYAPLEEAKGTYGSVAKLAGAISHKEALTMGSGAVFADNVKKYEDNSVTGGKLTLGVEDDDPTIFGPLLGRKKRKVSTGSEAEKEVYIGNSEDIPIPVGFGFIEYGRSEKRKFYEVNFYPKVVFYPYDRESETKKENTDFKTPSIEGTLYNIQNGDYKYENRFDTLLEAVQVLYGLFGVTEVPPETLANIGVNTGTQAEPDPAGNS